MVRVKQTVALVIAWYLAVWANLTHFPSQAYAVAVATRIQEEEWLQQSTIIRWDKRLSKAYAKALMKHSYPQWDRSEFRALAKLWGKESAWNPEADNPNSTAFGIPQLLNLHPSTPAPLQIERGLVYIQHRYDKPSIAWAHWRTYGWY
jgi:hypothetical protein